MMRARVRRVSRAAAANSGSAVLPGGVLIPSASASMWQPLCLWASFRAKKMRKLARRPTCAVVTVDRDKRVRWFEGF